MEQISSSLHASPEENRFFFPHVTWQTAMIPASLLSGSRISVLIAVHMAPNAWSVWYVANFLPLIEDYQDYGVH